ncbi:MAG: EamA family transporter [Chloroflexota bacterium]
MKLKGIVSLTGYAIVISTVGFFARMIDGLDLLTVVFFRAWLAAAFIFIWVAATGTLRDLAPKNLPVMGLSALSQGLMMVLFIGATLNTSIANAVFLTYTAPVFAILFSWFFLGEKISAATIGSFVLTAVGVLLIVDVSSFSLNGQILMGDLMALGAGVCYAGSTVTAKALSEQNKGQSIVFWQMALTGFALIPFIQMPTPEVLLPVAMPLLGLGVLATGCSYLLFMVGVRHVPGQQVLIVTSLETIIPASFAWMIFGESLSGVAIVASVLILCGVIWVQLADMQSIEMESEDIHTAPTVRLHPVVVNR